jgi:hypothetical protein
MMAIRLNILFFLPSSSRFGFYSSHLYSGKKHGCHRIVTQRHPKNHKNNMVNLALTR